MTGEIHTKYWKTAAFNPERKKIIKAASLIKAGRVVAFPTETVYGLGADALNPEAVERIFLAKGRPADNPLIVHLAYFWQVSAIVKEFTPKARLLAQKFWPGPLTLILPKAEGVSEVVTGGLSTVALRIPNHKAALELISYSGCPVAAPSANPSVSPSPTTARHVLRSLYGRIDGILDGGTASVGVESTVLDVTGTRPVILRPGGITKEQLESAVGPVESGDSEIIDEDEAVRSPGMKYRHYSPRADLILVEGSNAEKICSKIVKLTFELQQKERTVAILCSREINNYQNNMETKPDYMEVLGSRQDMKSIARNLYGALYRCDIRGIDVILVESFPTTGIGAAVMNRLSRAAAGSIIRL